MLLKASDQRRICKGEPEGASLGKTFKDTSRLRDMTLASLMGTLTAILMLFQVPLFLPFLKLDLADGVLLYLASFMTYPWLILTVVIKVALFSLLKGDEYSWLGAFMSAIASLSLIIPANLFWRAFGLGLKRAVIGGILGIVVSTITMTALNYVLLSILFGSEKLKEMLLMGVIPFNLVRGSLALVIMVAICRISGVFLKRGEEGEAS